MFVGLLCQSGIACTSDFEDKLDDGEMLKKAIELEELAEFFVDLSLKSYDFYRYTSLMVACSAIACARKALGLAAWR